VHWAGRYAAEVKTLESKGNQSTIRHLFLFSMTRKAEGATTLGDKS
jgi:hypothetical protein